jgi:hypothetical protein
MTSHLAQFSARAHAAGMNHPPMADHYEAMNITEERQYASHEEPPDALTQCVPILDVRAARATRTRQGPQRCTAHHASPVRSSHPPASRPSDAARHLDCLTPRRPHHGRTTMWECRLCQLTHPYARSKHRHRPREGFHTSE